MPSVITEPVRPGAYVVSEDNGSRSREVAVITGGVDLPAGTVLGQVTVGTTATVAAQGTNTGGGSVGAVAVGAAQAGAYTLRMESATRFIVEDPGGVQVGQGATGTPFTGGGLSFTVTVGSPAFAAGDSFVITVATGSLKMRMVNPAATDGSQVAAAILYEATLASAGDVAKTVSRRAMEANGLVLTWPSGMNAAQQAAAIAQLGERGIIVRT